MLQLSQGTQSTTSEDLHDLRYTFRTIVTLAGLFFPVFFLQLNAIKNGISSDVAFYAVGLA